PGAPAGPVGLPEQGWTAWPRFALVCLLLGALSFLSFYRPLQRHFWGGCDEFHNFCDVTARVWSQGWDNSHNRPLLGLSSVIAKALTPGSVEGFLWLATALCCANGLLLTMILRRAVPRLGSLAFAAGVLLVVNRADPSRFFVMWTTNFYLTALFFFLVALWLLLLSRDRGSRPLLLCACVALAA